ncbi:hypothetical protein [Chryseobacterium foetidum]|uniref:hypothetical protein n=1 Tax=Chryseobacterium foetidum TaxID=2951057 RepID=UPI0021CA81D3|nr:hypothetical protein [Chryseobacterium foetidum]
MLTFRVFIIIYLTILSALFNSRWADESLDNIPRVHQNTEENGINFLDHSYMNVKAVQVGSGSIKVFAVCNEPFEAFAAFDFKNTLTKYFSVNAEPKFCAVKAYLHLLQKF